MVKAHSVKRDINNEYKAPTSLMLGNCILTRVNTELSALIQANPVSIIAALQVLSI